MSVWIRKPEIEACSVDVNEKKDERGLGAGRADHPWVRSDGRQWAGSKEEKQSLCTTDPSY